LSYNQFALKIIAEATNNSHVASESTHYLGSIIRTSARLDRNAFDYLCVKASRKLRNILEDDVKQNATKTEHSPWTWFIVAMCWYALIFHS
jgi:hypothetical protein